MSRADRMAYLTLRTRAAEGSLTAMSVGKLSVTCICSRPIGFPQTRAGARRSAVGRAKGVIGLDLWVPKTCATWLDALGIAVSPVKRLGVGRPVLARPEVG
jgi:hypothetical protein